MEWLEWLSSITMEKSILKDLESGKNRETTSPKKYLNCLLASLSAKLGKVVGILYLKEVMIDRG